MTGGERALVLGGGGATGNAWLIGVVAGLSEAGVDVTSADLIIGTSAGSTAAAQIAGAPVSRLLANILAEAPVPRVERGANPAAANPMVITGDIIATARNPADMRRRLGAAALERDAAEDGSAQARWRATVASRLPAQSWPEQALRITAVNARTGVPVMLDRHSGVDLADAVAASCANGFGVPPYRVGGVSYIDGAYRANENADLAAGYARVLVLSPLGGRSRHPVAWGTHLAAQTEVLRAQGSRVESLLPDGEAQAALGLGMEITDLSRRRPSAEAGRRQGQALAGRLTEFWR